MKPLLLSSCLLLLAATVCIVSPALACPQVILRECWLPWGTDSLWRACSVENGTTYCQPDMPFDMPRWGLNANNYYDYMECADDANAMWCYGWPASHDPEYDIYPPNYDTYLVWGPFSLEGMESAQCQFRLYSNAEAGHDSIFWGASTGYPLTDAVMKIAGREYNTPDGWETRFTDLSNLRDFLTGDSVSLLGQDSVYLFWRFRSDPNNTRGVGSFIDNIVVTVDDGRMDLAAGAITLLHPDSSVVSPPVFAIGDTLMARYEWSACDGDTDYAPFQVMLTVNSTLIVSQTVTGMHSGGELVAYSPMWFASEWGQYIVRLAVDTLNAIPESDENNNDTTASYAVLPVPQWPNFNWITPGIDTLFADSVATLRWWFEDLEQPSTASVFYSLSPENCAGTLVPGGVNRPPVGIDSLVWDTRDLPHNRTYYLFAVIAIDEIDTCIYAPSPVHVLHFTGVADDPRPAIPAAHFLAQNYPNPFNPATEIRYGVAQAGQVTLRVYNLLGQEQATLVDANLSPGTFTAVFDGTHFSTGVYLYVLTTPEGTLRQKMILLR